MEDGDDNAQRNAVDCRRDVLSPAPIEPCGAACAGRGGSAMTAARSLSRSEPFAEETSGFGYFASATHYALIAARIVEQWTAHRGFVLVTSESGVDANHLVPRLQDDVTQFRVSLVRCRPGMEFDELIRAFGRVLGITLGSESSGRLWPIVSHLMLEARGGVHHVLALDAPDQLSADVFSELHRLAKIDDPPLLPVVLLTKSSFVARLEEPELSFLKAAITARLRLEWLEPNETELFIGYQANQTGEMAFFSPETIEAIAKSSNGDPTLVNRFASRTLEFLRRSEAEFAAAQSASEAVREIPAEPTPAALAPPEETLLDDGPLLNTENLDEVSETPPLPHSAPVIQLDLPAREWKAEREPSTALSVQPAEPVVPGEPAKPETARSPSDTADDKLAIEGEIVRPRRGWSMQGAIIAYFIAVIVSGGVIFYLLAPTSTQPGKQEPGKQEIATTGAAPPSVSPEQPSPVMTPPAGSVATAPSARAVPADAAADAPPLVAIAPAAGLSAPPAPQPQVATTAFPATQQEAAAATAPTVVPPAPDLTVIAAVKEPPPAPVAPEPATTATIVEPDRATPPSAAQASDGAPAAANPPKAPKIEEPAASETAVPAVAAPLSVQEPAKLVTIEEPAPAMAAAPALETPLPAAETTPPAPIEEAARSTSAVPVNETPRMPEPTKLATLEAPPPSTAAAPVAQTPPAEPTKPATIEEPALAITAPPVAPTQPIEPPEKKAVAIPAPTTKPAKPATIEEPAPATTAPPVAPTQPIEPPEKKAVAIPAPTTKKQAVAAPSAAAPAPPAVATIKEPDASATAPIARTPPTAPPPKEASAAAASTPKTPAVTPPIIVAPAPPPSAARSANSAAPSAETNLFIRRGTELLVEGDIISARLFFERAAGSGDARAATGLGKSYDPLFLKEAGVRGISGDPAKAATWYRTAIRSGDAGAEARLKKLIAAYPSAAKE
jgi:type II secretory pathway predicted ATPase ExeA